MDKNTELNDVTAIEAEPTEAENQIVEHQQETYFFDKYGVPVKEQDKGRIASVRVGDKAVTFEQWQKEKHNDK